MQKQLEIPEELVATSQAEITDKTILLTTNFYPKADIPGFPDQLRHIMGYAIFDSVTFTSLKKLRSIQGNAGFEDSPINDLGELRHIGGEAGFSNCPLIGLGKIESIGTAYFCNSNIVDLGAL